MAGRDATFRLKISPDKMRALADYTPVKGDGAPVTPSSVDEKMREMGIRMNVSKENIASMCESDRPVTNIIIAEGVKPKKGSDAKIETIIKITNTGKAREREDGSVDFRDLGEITSATEGQELYRKIPPTIGDPGYDVFGAEIPGLPGRDLKLFVGRGTKIDEFDQNLVRASASGEVLFKKGIIEVSEIHSVPGDVDYSSGNIKFNGSVKIGGSVKSGFSVEASGTIEISGAVEDAQIIGGHDVVIHGGFTGTGEGKVSANQDVMVKFIENQHIEAARDIIISGESYHATLQAGRSVMAKGAKSMIVGGVCQAKFAVETKSIGSVACAPTMVKVGIDPKLTDRLKAVEEEIASSEETLKKIEQSVVFLYRQKIDSNNTLPPDKAALLNKLEAAKSALPDKLTALKGELSSLQQTKEDIEKSYVVAETAVHPKVQVYIGHQFISINDTLGPSRFRLVEGDVARLSN